MLTLPALVAGIGDGLMLAAGSCGVCWLFTACFTSCSEFPGGKQPAANPVCDKTSPQRFSKGMGVL